MITASEMSKYISLCNYDQGIWAAGFVSFFARNNGVSKR